jgi:hypothetical protein
MQIQEFKDQHTKLYSAQRKEGLINKLFVLFLLVPATIFGYYFIGGGNEDAIIAKELTQNQIIVLALGFGFVSAGIVLLANSLSFVFPTKIWYAKGQYKKDIFKVIKAVNPEVQYFIPNKKISAKEFYSSGMFTEIFQDYTGDDWFKVSYNNVVFIMCDLHVTRLFKEIFQGLFVVYYSSNKKQDILIKFSETDRMPVNSTFLSEETINLIACYCTKHNKMISISRRTNSIFLAIGRTKNIFERGSLKTISTFENEAEIFRTNLQIVECVINDLK